MLWVLSTKAKVLVSVLLVYTEREEVDMKPIQLFPLSAEAIAELDHLYRTAPNMQVRTRAQMVLLSGEQGMVAHEIAAIVRKGVCVGIECIGYETDRVRVVAEMILRRCGR